MFDDRGGVEALLILNNDEMMSLIAQMILENCNGYVTDYLYKVTC